MYIYVYVYICIYVKSLLLARTGNSRLRSLLLCYTQPTSRRCSCGRAVTGYIACVTHKQPPLVLTTAATWPVSVCCVLHIPQAVAGRVDGS